RRHQRHRSAAGGGAADRRRQRHTRGQGGGQGGGGRQRRRRRRRSNRAVHPLLAILRNCMPSRLIPASEEGAVFKDWGGRLPVALIYPNTYAVGMSSLGFQALYGIFNAHDDVVCERAFMPDTVSLESGRALRDFPVLAFSFTYELDYF